MMPASKGYSLTELIIVLGLSSFISLAVIEFFNFYQGEYRQLKDKQQQLSETLLLKDYLQDLYLKSGFYGCYQKMPENPVIFSNSTQAIPTVVARKMKKNTQGLVFSFQDTTPLLIMLPLYAGSQVLYLKEEQGIKANQILVISDCHHSEQVQVVKVSDRGRRLVLAQPLEHDFQKMTHVARARALYLFVGQNSLKEEALFIRDKRSEVLIRYIDNMEIREISTSAIWIKLYKSRSSSGEIIDIFLRKII